MPRGLQLIQHEWIGPGAGDQSPVEQFDLQGGSAVRMVDLSWDQRALAVAQILGYPTVNEDDPNAITLSRYLPDFHPDFPWMVATEIQSLRGVGPRGYTETDGKKSARFDTARLAVRYAAVDYDLLEDDEIETEFDRYVIPEANPSATYLSPPTSGLKWSEQPAGAAGDKAIKGKPFPGNIGLIVGEIDFVYTWLQVPFDAMPQLTARRYVGTVNADVFPTDNGFDPGTLLMTGFKPIRRNSPFGLRTFDVIYTMKFNRRGHNKLYDWHNNDFFQATRSGTFYEPGSIPVGETIFDENDFANLFDPTFP